MEELVLIAIVAVVVFGKDLPRVARDVGRVYMRFKSQFLNVRDDMMRSIELEETRRDEPPATPRIGNTDGIEDPVPPPPPEPEKKEELPAN